MDFEQRLKGQVPESVKFLEDLGFVWDGSGKPFEKLRGAVAVIWYEGQTTGKMAAGIAAPIEYVTGRNDAPR